MAYAEQPHFGGSRRPQHEHQRPTYAPSLQSYTAEFDYAPEQRDFHGGSKPRFQQYPSTTEPKVGSSKKDRGQFHNTNTFDSNRNEYHASTEPNDSHRPIAQQPRQQAADAHTYRGPQTKQQPYPTPRAPDRNAHSGAESYRGFQDTREPWGNYQQHRLDRGFDYDSMRQGDTGYGYKEPSWKHEDVWSAGQQYGHSAKGDPRQPDPTSMEQSTANQHYRGGENRSQNNKAYAPQDSHNEPPRSSHGKPSSSSSRSETSQRSKTSSKRRIETPASPDTVAWDNPFPTFPMRPKKSANPSSDNRSAHGSNFRDLHRREKSQEDRPQTASSKSSSYTIAEPQSIDGPMFNAQSKNDGYSDRNDHYQEEARMKRGIGDERPRYTEGGPNGYAGHLKPPAIQSRHSEDNQIRPAKPQDADPNPTFERSRTMPTAISDEMVKPNNRRQPTVQTQWQEPGPNASYYGPEDRGYTPTSPGRTAEAAHRRPFGQLRGQYDEKRPYGHTAVQSPASSTRQLHTPQDSLGDVFDNYYDSTHEDPPISIKASQSQYQSARDEEMPNFDGVADQESSHRRGLTIDDHLQPQQLKQERPPMPRYPQDDFHTGHGSDIYSNRAVPRSKSQPDLKNRRPPRRQLNDGFDFGVPGSSRPPATAPAGSNNAYEYHDNTPTSSSNWDTISSSRDQYRGFQEISAEAQVEDYPHNHWKVPTFQSGPPAAYHPGVEPQRMRPAPYNGRGRGRGNGPTAHPGHMQADRFRSPPFRGGPPRQGPTRFPQGRTPPDGRAFGNDTTSMPHQSHRNPPPVQNAPAQRGQMKSPNSEQSSSTHVGPKSPPAKSPVNPDALPAHPAPVRAGLMEGSSSNSAAKPVPVRQYNATPSPMQLSDPGQRPGSSQATDSKRESIPVTHQELDRLRQVTARNPDDMATQLVLAKKLAEASSVLVDERADQRTRSKNRDKYISDGLKIVKKLSSSGYSEATFYLADCYTRGSLGLESDTREAFRLYQTAAKIGHPQAAYRVAVCCEIGQEEGGGTSRDPVKAMQWYKRAATLGDAPAMYKMGIIALKGLLGQPKNPKEALPWLRRAAERADRENPHALHELALLHEKPSSNDGVNKDEAYSRQLFTQAANLGYKFSQYRLGCAYEYGLLGCPVDPRQSIAWYSKAAVQEEHQSELALSGWYLTGSEGILQQSDTEAYLWARKAAQAGLAKAEYAMGYFTEVGIGSSANLEDAKRWYWRAASQNFPKARDRLEDLRKGGPIKRKERVSRSNIRKSSEGDCLVM